jgi:2-succinyl-5-enolpyruvyl-6-hydroxy-3-cyclohexene-1-carboxylate synthase
MGRNSTQSTDLKTVFDNTMKQLSAKTGVQILVNALKQHGVTHVVFSPGSRNAPLVIGILGSGAFQTVSLPDERSAAFFAMGMAQQLGKPVPVICTSGSALLNYAPAVAEAYYQRIPFLVISADRPLEWIDQGDGQTIRQQGVFSNFTDYAVSLPVEPVSASQQWFYHREIHTALNHAVRGVAHINIPFEEPLYEFTEEVPALSEALELVQPENRLSDAAISQLKDQWRSARKRMIVIGQLNPDVRLWNALEPFIQDPDTAILVENTSNVVHPRLIACIDRTLATIEGMEEEFAPELLLSFGGAVVSKKIKAFLRKANVKAHWKIGAEFPFMDTYQQLTHSIPMSPAVFFEQLVHGLELTSSSQFGNAWKQRDYVARDAHAAFLATAPYSDLKVMEVLLDAVPEKSHIHLGNSSVVRYAQLFDPIRGMSYWSNRGTSGIDGSVSTAAGAAFVKPNDTHILVVGDISFFYDSNALWNQFLTPNLRILVVHNGGGGIFKIIPGPDSTPHLDDYFVTRHPYSAEYLCKAFDVTYFRADSEEELEVRMNDWLQPTQNGRPALLEVHTPIELNDRVLKDYFNTIRYASNK